MTRRWFTLRLEPSRPAGDPGRGFAADIADPAWLVGRQWQLGEQHGENASSPIDAALTLRRVPIGASASRPLDDPRQVPAEAIVEDEPGSWWTIGRRLRLGLAARDAGLVGAPGDEALLFRDLTGPYAALNGVAYDGRAVHAVQPFPEVPVEPADAWRTDELGYRIDLPAGGTVLSVGGREDPATKAWVGHDGGDVDWWSVDADQPVADDAGAAGDPPEHRWPERFSWPGGPARRWWQIEDRQVDLGGLPPDRGHFASVLLLDLLFGHGDDWFVVPIPTRRGHVLSVDGCEVTDAFGDTWSAIAPGGAAPPGAPWTLFQVAGLGARQLPIWLTAVSPLAGEPVELVVVGEDEDANLVWAVEERLDGAATSRLRPDPLPPSVVDDTAPPAPPPTFAYQPTTAVPDHWHPYTREVDGAGAVVFRQGRLVAVGPDGTPDRRPAPTARLLQPRGAGVHVLAPWRLPPTGLRLERRALLARTTTGQPVLWTQRRRAPLLSMPSSGLRFDALTPLPRV